MAVYTKTANDVFAPTTAGGAPRGADMGDAQTWGTEVEKAIAAREAEDQALSNRITDEVSSLSEQIEAAAEGAVLAATWSDLSAITGARASQPARVPVSDTGTHTDPVVGGTVPNSGEYAWSASPAGWERVGAVFDPAAPTAAINLSSVGFRSASAYREGQSWTVSWSQLRGVWGGSVVVIADLAQTVLATTECVYIDLAGASPYTPVKASTNSTLRSDFAAGRKLLLLHNQTGSLVGSLAPHLLATSINDRMQWDQDEIAVRVMNNGEIRIYQKGSNPASSRYLYYRVSRFLSSDTDVWAIKGIFDADRTDRLTFAGARRICSLGNNEIAIRQALKTDAMGGQAHGDEKLTRDAYLLIDGRRVSLTPADHTWYRCRKVELIQETELFEADTVPVATNVLATVQRRMEWVDGEMWLDNRVEFLSSITLTFCYLAMLTIQRVSESDPGFQITDEGFRDPHWAREDISTAGFGTSYTPSGYLKLSGPNGYTAEVEAIAGWDKPNRAGHIADDAPYNKVRLDFTGTGYVTEPDEVIHGRVRYRIMNNN